jgi:hypothetical protein
MRHLVSSMVLEQARQQADRFMTRPGVKDVELGADYDWLMLFLVWYSVKFTR